MSTPNIPVGPEQEQEAQEILAMIYTAPGYKLVNAFTAMSHTLARALNPNLNGIGEEVKAALRLAKMHLESVENEPEYVPACLMLSGDDSGEVVQ